jgi:hypothetical protein
MSKHLSGHPGLCKVCDDRLYQFFEVIFKVQDFIRPLTLQKRHEFFEKYNMNPVAHLQCCNWCEGNYDVFSPTRTR